MTTTPTMRDRLHRAFRELVRAEFPRLVYLGVYEYAIQATSSGTVDASPVDTTIGLPDIVKIPMRSSVLGATVTPTVGNRCLVCFVNGDPTRPACVGIDPTPVTAVVDATNELDLGPSASTVKIAGGGPASVRVGDVVNAGYMIILTATGGVDLGGGTNGYYPATTAGLAAATTRLGILNSTPGTAVLISMTGGRPTSGSTKVTVG